jgi:hypothetical protein
MIKKRTTIRTAPYLLQFNHTQALSSSIIQCFNHHFYCIGNRLSAQSNMLNILFVTTFITLTDYLLVDVIILYLPSFILSNKFIIII